MVNSLPWALLPAKGPPVISWSFRQSKLSQLMSTRRNLSLSVLQLATSEGCFWKPFGGRTAYISSLGKWQGTSQLTNLSPCRRGWQFPSVKRLWNHALVTADCQGFSSRLLHSAKAWQMGESIMPMVGRHWARSPSIKETRQIGRNLNSSSRQQYRAWHKMEWDWQMNGAGNKLWRCKKQPGLGDSTGVLMSTARENERKSISERGPTSAERGDQPVQKWGTNQHRNGDQPAQKRGPTSTERGTNHCRGSEVTLWSTWQNRAQLTARWDTLHFWEITLICSFKSLGLLCITWLYNLIFISSLIP